jgi:hypothetical protein
MDKPLVTRTGVAPSGATVDLWERDGGALCGYTLTADGKKLEHWPCGKSEGAARKGALEALRARKLLLPGERMKWSKPEEAASGDGPSGTGEAGIRRRTHRGGR